MFSCAIEECSCLVNKFLYGIWFLYSCHSPSMGCSSSVLKCCAHVFRRRGRVTQCHVSLLMAIYITCVDAVLLMWTLYRLCMWTLCAVFVLWVPLFIDIVGTCDFVKHEGEEWEGGASLSPENTEQNCNSEWRHRKSPKNLPFELIAFDESTCEFYK